jgi:hypothetical protein
LYALCDKHLSADASPSDLLIATNTAISNGKEILFQLLKTNKIYSEMQLLLGYYHKQGSYDGAVEFIQSHYKEQDPLSCPSSWSTEPQLCSICHKLSTLYDTLNNLPSIDSRILNDFNDEEEKLDNLNRFILIYICVCIHICLQISINISIYIYVYDHIWKYVYTYISMYAQTYIYIYIYIHTYIRYV